MDEYFLNTQFSNVLYKAYFTYIRWCISQRERTLCQWTGSIDFRPKVVIFFTSKFDFYLNF